MASFLMNCPQCSSMIPKGGPCPECHWSEERTSGGGFDRRAVQEFSRRETIHKRNYAVFMILRMATGLFGLIAAIMWGRLIYFGDVVALVWIVLMTVLTGVFTVLLAFAGKLFPVALKCPSCDIRLDEIPLDRGHCPNCSAPLKLETSQGASAAGMSPV